MFILIFYAGLRELGSNNFRTQVTKTKRPVRPAFPDYLSVSYDYGSTSIGARDGFTQPNFYKRFDHFSF